MQKDEEDMLGILKQAKTWMMISGRSTVALVGVNHEISKPQKQEFQCYNCGMRTQLKKHCWHK